MYKFFVVTAFLWSSGCLAQPNMEGEFTSEICEASLKIFSERDISRVLASDAQLPLYQGESLGAIAWHGIPVAVPAHVELTETDILQNKVSLTFGDNEVIYWLSVSYLNNWISDESQFWSELKVEYEPLSNFERIKLAFRITPDNVNCHSLNRSKVVNQLLGFTMKQMFIAHGTSIEIGSDGSLSEHSRLGKNASFNKSSHYIPLENGSVVEVTVLVKPDSIYANIGSYVDTEFPVAADTDYSLLEFIENGMKQFKAEGK